MGFIILLCLLFVPPILSLGIRYINNKRPEKLTRQYVLIEETDINSDLEERFQFVHSENIIIHNMDEWFYKSLEEHRDFYEKIVKDSQKFKELLKEGMSISDIRRMEGYEHSAAVCFDLSMAIMGEEVDGKINLTNGRHRCRIAKELGVEVPIYITGKYITKLNTF